jgi:hypothetical protein
LSPELTLARERLLSEELLLTYFLTSVAANTPLAIRLEK